MENLILIIHVIVSIAVKKVSLKIFTTINPGSRVTVSLSKVAGIPIHLAMLLVYVPPTADSASKISVSSSM